MQENLSPREREIFDLLLEGVSPKKIAYKLNISHSTVDFPYSSLYLPEWYEQYAFDFNKETIKDLSITANFTHGLGSSLLQIFDFEIY